MSDKRETLVHQIECVMEDWKQHGHRDRMEYANRIATLFRADERAKTIAELQARAEERIELAWSEWKVGIGKGTLQERIVAAIFDKEG